jgi:putative methyltransferase (TIGR04325 family)
VIEHIWEGIYGSFAEAPAVGDGFAGRTWGERSSLRAMGLRQAAQEQRTIPSIVAYPSSLLPFLAATICQGQGDVRILDFGGALGYTYYPVIAALPDAQHVEYHIVDTALIVRLGSQMFAEDERVSFHESLPIRLEDVDIVHIGSSLQYVEDWQGTLEMLAAYGAPRFLFTDLPAGDIPTYVSLQNYYESKIPCWFFNVGDVMAVMAGLGYRLAFKSTYLSTILGKQEPFPQDNFPEEYRLGYPASLMFCAES